MARRRDEDILRRVGRRVAQARKAGGFTQEQLAEAIDVEPVTLSRLETGDRAMSLSSLASISKALGVGLADLVGVEKALPEPEHRPEEAELLRVFNGLSSKQKKVVLALVRELSAKAT